MNKEVRGFGIMRVLFFTLINCVTHLYKSIMAEDKKGIIVYADWIDKFEELEDDEAGRLIKHFFRYVNDLDPEPPDRLTKICFVDIQNQLKRDLKKWEGTVEGRSYNGRLGNLKRWNLDLYNDVVLEKTSLQEAEIIAKYRKASLPDNSESQNIANIAVNDNVTVNVNDTVNDILLKKETKQIFNFKKAMIDFGFEEFLIDEWLKVRKTKKATNTETAFKKFTNQVKIANAPINEILELCITKSWSGFEAEWFFNLKKDKNPTEKEQPMIGRMTQSTMEKNFMKFANVKIPQ